MKTKFFKYHTLLRGKFHLGKKVLCDSKLYLFLGKLCQDGQVPTLSMKSHLLEPLKFRILRLVVNSK